MAKQHGFGMFVANMLATALLVFAALGAAPLLLAADVPGVASDSATQISQAEVWQSVMAELNRLGYKPSGAARLDPNEDGLELPTLLPARAGHTLRVESACWDAAAKKTQFRLACVSNACLPFIAYLRDGPVAGVESCRPAVVKQHAASAPAPVAATSLDAHVGDHGTVVYISGQLRIAASVILMDRGRAGEVVRVRTDDGQIFRALLTSAPGQLEAIRQ